MREIKFRAWDKTEKKMVSIYEIIFTKSKGIGIRVKPHKPTYLYNIEIMQFTGLKDKNGKEIYEGDIIHSKWEENYVGSDDSKEIVFFHNGEFVMNKSGKPEEFNFSVHFHCHPKHIKVIGNIYENHELLKK